MPYILVGVVSEDNKQITYTGMNTRDGFTRMALMAYLRKKMGTDIPTVMRSFHQLRKHNEKREARYEVITVPFNISKSGVIRTWTTFFEAGVAVLKDSRHYYIDAFAIFIDGYWQAVSQNYADRIHTLQLSNYQHLTHEMTIEYIETLGYSRLNKADTILPGDIVVHDNHPGWEIDKSPVIEIISVDDSSRAIHCYGRILVQSGIFAKDKSQITLYLTITGGYVHRISEPNHPMCHIYRKDVD